MQNRYASEIEAYDTVQKPETCPLCVKILPKLLNMRILDGLKILCGKKSCKQRKMNMKKLLLAALIGIASILSGCFASTQESTKEAVALSDASVGDVVVFGDIRWYVTAKTETSCTLLTEKPVIKLPFNVPRYHCSNTWDQSTLREWLNEKFYYTFTEEERALISLTHNSNPPSAKFGTPGGEDTDDYIFLLSVDEANALDSQVRKAGYWYDMNDQWWWLRSPGANESYIAYVGTKKNVVDPSGDVAGNTYGAVRPALNLRLSGDPIPTKMHKTAAEEKELAVIADSQVDDVVAFGRYTWYVADKSDGICTLLCAGPVAKMPYNDEKTDVTWETCSLRRWLNVDFFDSKFSDGEKAAIVTTHNTFTEEESHYGMDCGNETDDKVYLFTDSEAKIVSDDIRGCGIDWWLRSPGKEQNEAVYILGTAANYMGNDVDHSMGVRPVIRVRYAEQTAEQ